MAEPIEANSEYPVWIPSRDEIDAQNKVIRDFTTGRDVVTKGYNQLNGRNIYDAVDDWTKRWNGYIPESSSLIDPEQSQVFLNFTRNQIISYLSKIAMQRPDSKIKAVNKKNGMNDKKFAQVLKDLNQYSLDEENADARFMEAALECSVKGTVHVYEGYARNVQKMKVPDGFDMMTGKGKFKEEERIVFDNCFQKIIPLEDIYIANPYQPDIQQQPFVIWRQFTTYEEGEADYGHYKNWKYVRPGQYTIVSEPTTFYRNQLYTELQKNQVEIVRYYNRAKNEHIVMINGIIIYDGPIPFKDGKYPFAKGIHEPFDNFFYWGAGAPNKYMGEQDLMNTTFNMAVDKMYGSLLPFVLSSDLDDVIDDDRMQVNKIRKVGDIEKWKFVQTPDVTQGEQNMLQMIMGFAKENAGGSSALTPRGGKLTARQILQQQQENMQRLGFSASYLEDFDRDRTILRIGHILQFYSIPKMEKVTGKNGKEIEQLAYRDVRLSETALEGNKTGNKIIKIVPKPKNEDELKVLQDKLSVDEAMGDELGTPTQAVAVVVDTFYDYNYSVQVVKNSSYERNAALDQASRLEFAQWRIPLAQFAPLDLPALVDWVSEAFDVDAEQFKQKQQPMMGQMGPQPGQPQQMQPGADSGPTGAKPVMPQIQPTALSNALQ